MALTGSSVFFSTAFSSTQSLEGNLTLPVSEAYFLDLLLPINSQLITSTKNFLGHSCSYHLTLLYWNTSRNSLHRNHTQLENSEENCKLLLQKPPFLFLKISMHRDFIYNIYIYIYWEYNSQPSCSLYSIQKKSSPGKVNPTTVQLIEAEESAQTP